MFVKISDKVLMRVDFRRTDDFATECRINVKDGDEWADVAGGISHLHPNDRYDKLTGKKVSLEKALHSLFAQTGVVNPIFPDKDVRSKIWTEFFKQFGHLLKKAG